MKLDSIALKQETSNIDLFICSSGFESRSKSVINAIDITSATKALIFHIDENYIVSCENLTEIKQAFPHIEVVQHPKNNPLETYDLILQQLNLFFETSSKTKNNVLIDITTFTRETLLILFKAISQIDFLTRFEIKLVYTPAENYPNDWLTKGVRYIRSVFGYSGMMNPKKKLLLLMLNGFESERTEEIINSFEPNVILLGKPSNETAINSELGKRGSESFGLIKQKYFNTVKEDFEFSCTDIDKTVSVLEKLIEKYESDYNIVVSPLNNKISTIATAFVALKNESVQVCYASANQYNINEYSTPCDYFLIFEMNEFLK